jgi:hypothetical protein
MGPAGQELHSAGSGRTSVMRERLGNGEELLSSVNPFEKTSTAVILPCEITYFVFRRIILPSAPARLVSEYSDRSLQSCKSMLRANMFFPERPSSPIPV